MRQAETVVTGQPGDRRPWAFFSGFDIGIEGDPYLDRLRIIQTPWFGWYLHKIHRPDLDRDPHDHPWKIPLLDVAFISIVLCGQYTEVVWPDKRDPGQSCTRTHRRFSAHIMSWNSAHSITRIDGSLWTMVFTGRRHRDGWGFWLLDKPGTFVPWREYITTRRAA